MPLMAASMPALRCGSEKTGLFSGPEPPTVMVPPPEAPPEAVVPVSEPESLLPQPAATSGTVAMTPSSARRRLRTFP
jgi:hypothetical protein